MWLLISPGRRVSRKVKRDTAPPTWRAERAGGDGRDGTSQPRGAGAHCRPKPHVAVSRPAFHSDIPGNCSPVPQGPEQGPGVSACVQWRQELPGQDWHTSSSGHGPAEGPRAASGSSVTALGLAYSRVATQFLFSNYYPAKNRQQKKGLNEKI